MRTLRHPIANKSTRLPSHAPTTFFSFFREKISVCIYSNKSQGDNLEDTLAVTEGGNVAACVLLVHGLAGKDLSNHVAHDTHHSGAAVVKLNIKLTGLVLRVKDVRAEVTDAVVTVILGGRHPGKLNKGEEGKDLEKTSSAIDRGERRTQKDIDC